MVARILRLQKHLTHKCTSSYIEVLCMISGNSSYNHGTDDRKSRTVLEITMWKKWSWGPCMTRRLHLSQKIEANITKLDARNTKESRSSTFLCRKSSPCAKRGKLLSQDMPKRSATLSGTVKEQCDTVQNHILSSTARRPQIRQGGTPNWLRWNMLFKRVQSLQDSVMGIW